MSFEIELFPEKNQLVEALACLLHTIFVHRTMGKFHYQDERTFSVSPLETEDVDCKNLDFTYVRVASKSLDALIYEHAQKFRNQLQKNSGIGTVTLEFYHQKNLKRWLFANQSVTWEKWNINVKQNPVKKSIIGLDDKIIEIVESVGMCNFMPKIPEKTELPSVFDTSFPDVQPYLFKIYSSFHSAVDSNQTATTMRSAVDCVFGGAAI